MAYVYGCHSVKFQKRKVDSVYTKEFLDSPRESPWGTTQREQKEGIEFGVSEYDAIDSLCHSLGIHWFASAWDLDSQEFLNSYDLPYHKIASAMITNVDLLTNVAGRKKHTFISTGMSSENEIGLAVEIFRNHSCSFELMHCVAEYPLSPSNANLKRISTLKDLYGCDVGYSGHEVGLSVSYAACAMGISSLERHVTMDRSMYGSDQASSLEMNGLRLLVKSSREIELSIGNGLVSPGESEMSSLKKLRS
jgi:N-acetylneuraminate synthase